MVLGATQIFKNSTFVLSVHQIFFHFMNNSEASEPYSSFFKLFFWLYLIDTVKTDILAEGERGEAAGLPPSVIWHMG